MNRFSITPHKLRRHPNYRPRMAFAPLLQAITEELESLLLSFNETLKLSDSGTEEINDSNLENNCFDNDDEVFDDCELSDEEEYGDDEATLVDSSDEYDATFTVESPQTESSESYRSLTSKVLEEATDEAPLVLRPPNWCQPCGEPNCHLCGYMNTASSYCIGDENVLRHCRKPFDCRSRNVVFAVDCTNPDCVSETGFRFFGQSSSEIRVYFASKIRKIKTETGTNVSPLSQHFTHEIDVNDPERCNISFMRITILQGNFGNSVVIQALKKIREIRAKYKKAIRDKLLQIQGKPLRICPLARNNSLGWSRPCSSCPTCPYLVSSKALYLDENEEPIPVNGHFNCESCNVVLVIRCQSCSFVFLGETTHSVKSYLLNILYDIEHNGTRTVAEHFKSVGVSNMQVIVLQGNFGGDAGQQLIDKSHQLRNKKVAELKKMFVNAHTSF